MLHSSSDSPFRQLKRNGTSLLRTFAALNTTRYASPYGVKAKRVPTTRSVNHAYNARGTPFYTKGHEGSRAISGLLIAGAPNAADRKKVAEGQSLFSNRRIINSGQWRARRRRRQRRTGTAGILMSPITIMGDDRRR